jgi:hypothetical protein
MRPLLSGDEERGSAVNVQAAVLYPLILITFMTLLQVGLYFYGRDLALSAARSGVDTGRVYGGTDTAAAQDHATEFITRTASGVLSAPSASVSTDGRTITVTVEATVTTLAPGLTLTVRQSSTGALEQVSP